MYKSKTFSSCICCSIVVLLLIPIVTKAIAPVSDHQFENHHYLQSDNNSGKIDFQAIIEEREKEEEENSKSYLHPIPLFALVMFQFNETKGQIFHHAHAPSYKYKDVPIYLVKKTFLL